MTGSSTALLACTDLRVCYREAGITVPDLSVRHGASIAVRLPSVEETESVGRALLGFELPAAGTIRLFDADTRAATPDQLLVLRRKLAWAPSAPSFLSTVPLKENVAIPLRDRRHPSETQLFRQTDLQLDALGASLDVRTLPQQASSSVRYLAGLARALLSEPELLIVSEPPGRFSQQKRELVRNALRSVRQTGDVAMILLVAGEVSDSTLFDHVIEATVGGA